MGPLFAMFGGVGTLIVLWLGGREVIEGRLTVGGLVAFNTYLVALSWPTIALGWVISMWQRGQVGWQRVRDVLATPPGIADAGEEAAAGAPALVPSIEVRDLTVERDGRKILDAVSFSLAAGDTLAIVGPTGSGKTTLVDAIPRLTEVAPGTIFVGGVDVTARSAAGAALAHRLRSARGIPVLRHDRREHRLRRRGDGADRAAVEAAAQAAGLTRDIAAFHDGYDTMVGERGITLSGGQRQRVALARALCADPRILILDDSLSSVDAETERRS